MLREEKKLTQKQIASIMGISVNYYSMIEKGLRQKNLSTDIIIKLSDVFNITPNEIIDFEIKNILGND